MFHYINDDCIVCDACRRECPVDAIRSGPKKYAISEGICVDCGSCAEVCPTRAIVSRAHSEAEVELGWGEAASHERMRIRA